MARLLLCIVPLLFGFCHSASLIGSVVSGAVDTVTDVLSLTNSTFAALDFVGLAAEDGYAATAHQVTTDDGYILTIFRLAGNGCSSNSSGRPVLLNHGVIESSDNFIDAGDSSLGYLLADDCYDLWLGNLRGNYYGRAHVSLDPDTDSQFWNYTIQEIAVYDVPAIIDYVLDTTGYDKLDYIGHSLACSGLLALTSQIAEYNDKVNLFIALAPPTRLAHSTSLALILLSESSTALQLLGGDEVLARGALTQTILEQLCSLADDLGLVYDSCETVLAFFDSYHLDSITEETTSKMYYHFPAGASLMLFNHFMQLLSASTFNKYNYGSAGNMELYGAAAAPAYNLTAVTVPTVIMQGLNDHLVSPIDSTWAYSQLGNPVEYITVNMTLWSHFDFVWSQYIPTEVYPTIKGYLESYNL